jgi:hypothetical protein
MSIENSRDAKPSGRLDRPAGRRAVFAAAGRGWC